MNRRTEVKRIWHPWWKWECYRHGLYETTCDLADDEAAELYAYFLRDPGWFLHHAEAVAKHWKHSCEHFLSNTSMNRVAWIGQASMCRATSTNGGHKAIRKGYQIPRRRCWSAKPLPPHTDQLPLRF